MFLEAAQFVEVATTLGTVEAILAEVHRLVMVSHRVCVLEGAAAHLASVVPLA